MRPKLSVDTARLMSNVCEFAAELRELLSLGSQSHQRLWPDVVQNTGQMVPRPGRRLGCRAPSRLGSEWNPIGPFFSPTLTSGCLANLPAPPAPEAPPGSAMSPGAVRGPPSL